MDINANIVKEEFVETLTKMFQNKEPVSFYGQEMYICYYEVIYTSSNHVTYSYALSNNSVIRIDLYRTNNGSR